MGALTRYSNLLLNHKLRQLAEMAIRKRRDPFAALVEAAQYTNVPVSAVLSEMEWESTWRARMGQSYATDQSALDNKWAQRMSTLDAQRQAAQAPREEPAAPAAPAGPQLPNDVNGLTEMLKKVVQALFHTHKMSDQQINGLVTQALQVMDKPNVSTVHQQLPAGVDAEKLGFGASTVAGPGGDAYRADVSATGGLDPNFLKSLGLGPQMIGAGLGGPEDGVDDQGGAGDTSGAGALGGTGGPVEKGAQQDPLQPASPTGGGPQEKKQRQITDPGKPAWYDQMTTSEKKWFDSLSPAMKKRFIGMHDARMGGTKDDPTSGHTAGDQFIAPGTPDHDAVDKIAYFLNQKRKQQGLPEDPDAWKKAAGLWNRQQIRKKMQFARAGRNQETLPSVSDDLLSYDHHRRLGNIISEWCHLAGIREEKKKPKRRGR